MSELGAFARRLLDGNRRMLASHPPLPAAIDQADPAVVCTLAVPHQLLVSESLLAASPTQYAEPIGKFRQALSNYTDPTSPVASVFDGLDHVGDDVHVFELRGQSDPSHAPDIFEVTRILRSALDVPGDPDGTAHLHSQVSPNHVLVPANEIAFCPYGPPTATDARGWLPLEAFPAPPAGSAEVTLIDAGYQWKGVAGDVDGTVVPAWPVAQNLIANLVTAVDADVLPGWQPWGGVPNNGQDVSDQQWTNCASSTTSPETAADGALVGLAGHANFVAGLIAQGCGDVMITIRNLNGAYEEGDVHLIPTEAAIARAIAMSKGAWLIHVSFAGPVCDGIPARVWDTALRTIGPDVVVVAPVGNEDSYQPRYPAALHASYPQVIGVGSTTAARGGPLDGEVYSNKSATADGWVTCSADGSGVVSTFLHVAQALEDASGQTQDFTGNSLASWNGTCFAAAKVSGEICARQTSGTSLQAWNDLVATGPRPGQDQPDLGINFDF